MDGFNTGDWLRESMRIEAEARREFPAGLWWEYGPKPDARLAVLSVTPELLADIFGEGDHRSYRATGLPADATVCGVRYNPEMRVMEMLVHSPALPEVPPGCCAPPVDVRVSVGDPPAIPPATLKPIKFREFL